MSNRRISRYQLAALFCVVLCIGACSTTSNNGEEFAQNAETSPPRAPTDALYQDLGGESGVAKLVDALIKRYQQDPRINEFFAQTDFAYFRQRLIEDICVRAGGPCTYQGLSMPDAHSGMQIRESEFNVFVEASQRAMDDIALPIKTQNRLLALLARERKDVIHQ